MAFLFQKSVAGSNQPNSIKAQVQRETIEPYQFLTILCSVPDVTHYTGKTTSIIICHNFTLRVSTEVGYSPFYIIVINSCS